MARMPDKLEPAEDSTEFDFQAPLVLADGGQRKSARPEAHEEMR